MMTRKPSLAMRSAVPNLTQFIWESENRPWSRMIGLPCPISRQASWMPSDAVQSWVAASVIGQRQCQPCPLIAMRMFCLADEPDAGGSRDHGDGSECTDRGDFHALPAASGRNSRVPQPPGG